MTVCFDDPVDVSGDAADQMDPAACQIAVHQVADAGADEGANSSARDRPAAFGKRQFRQRNGHALNFFPVLDIDHQQVVAGVEDR